MKKIFLALVFVFGSAAYMTMNALEPVAEADYRVIMTSCGDQFLVPASITDAQAAALCDLLDEALCG
jgi:hypothetical protein